ncbi:MAG: ABC transporter permease [Acidobacteria bacterium]|nr:ABC transporter permease [Acidobacteriota bacterium]
MLALRCPSVQLVTPMRTRSRFLGTGNEVNYGGEKMRGTIVRGVKPDYEGVLEVVVVEDGRFLPELDQDHRRAVCVIGQEVKRSLFPTRVGSKPHGKKWLRRFAASAACRPISRMILRSSRPTCSTPSGNSSPVRWSF